MVGATQTAWGRERIRDLAVTAIHDQLGLQAVFSQVAVDLEAFPPSLTIRAEGIILDDPVYGRFVEARALRIEPSLSALVQGEVDLARIEIDQPIIHLVVRDGELLNLPRPATSSDGPVDLPFETIAISDGTLLVDAQPLVNGELNGLDLTLRAREGDAGFNDVLDIEGGAMGGEVQHAMGTETVERFVADLSIVIGDGIDVHEAALYTEHLRVGLRDGRLSLPFSEETWQSAASVAVDLGHLDQLPHGFEIPELEGWVEVHATLRGSAEGPVAEGTVRLDRAKIIDTYLIGETAELVVSADKSGIRIREGSYVDLIRNGGRVGLQGSLDLDEERGFPVDLQIDLTNFEFATLMAQIDVSDNAIITWLFNGGGRLSGTLSPFHVRGPIDVRTTDMMISQDGHRDGPRSRVISVPRARLTADWSIMEDGMRFNRVVADTDHSRILGDIFLSFSTTVHVDARSEDIDARDITPLVNFPVAGHGPVRVVVSGDYSLPDVRGHAQIYDFTFDGFPLGDIETDFELAKGGNAVFFSDARAVKRQSRYSTRDLLIDFSDSRVEVTGRMNTSRLTMADLYHVFNYEGDQRFEPYQAIGNGSVAIRYTYGFPRDIPNTGTLDADIDLRIASANFTGFEFDGGRFSGKWHWFDWRRGTDGGVLDIEQFALRKGEGTVAITGRMTEGSNLDLNVAADQIAFRDTEGLGDRFPDLAGSYTVLGHVQGTASVPRAHMDIGFSGVSYDGAQLGDGRLYVRLTDRGDPWIRQTARWDADAPPDDAECPRGRLGLARNRWAADPPLRTVEGLLPALDRPMAFVMCGSGMGGQLDVDLAIGRTAVFPIRGVIDFNELSLAPILARYVGRDQEIDGELDGRIALTGGAMTNPDSLSGSVSLRSLKLGNDAIEIENDGAIQVDLTRGRFEVARGVLRGPGSNLRLTGGGSSRSGLGLRVDGAVDLGLLATVTDSFTRVRGRANLQLNVTGDLEAPEVFGEARVRGGAFRFASVPLPFEDMNGRATFDSRRITLDNFRARVGGGDVALAGFATIAGRGVSHYEVDIDARDVAFSPEDGIEVGLGAQAELAWSEGERLPLLRGQVRLDRVRYSREMSLSPTIGELYRPARAEVDRYDPDGDNLAVDLQIIDRAPIRVDNNMVDADVRIDDSERPFRVVGTDQRFGVLGNLSVPRGTVRFRNTELDVRSGIIRFDDETRVNPNFDVRTEAEIRRNQDLTAASWRIELRAHGDLDGFQLDASSTPQMTQQDIALLLTVGMTTSEAQQLQAGDFGGHALEALGEITGVNREVRDALVVIDDIAIRNVYSPTTNRPEPQLTIGKRIADRVRLSASTGLTGENRSFQTGVEWQLGEQTSVQASYNNVNRESSSSFGNLGLDFRWRLEFE